MRKKIASLLLLLTAIAVPAISSETLTWSVSGTPNDGASVYWMAVETPTQDGAETFTLNSFTIHVGYKNSYGSWGASSSYMLISKSNESNTSIESTNVVAISKNAPTPSNDYATYTFDDVQLDASSTYYLYWISSNASADTYTATTQRLSLFSGAYSPGICFRNGTNTTAYSPAFYTTLTYTVTSTGGDDDSSGEETVATTTGNEDSKDNVKQVLFNNASSSIPYRIPAIAAAFNGDLIALTDYRQGKADIGFGAVDIHAKVSRDNGSTWGSEFCIAGSTAISGADSQYYGDASIVADRESNNVLALLVCGTVGFTAATRDNPIHMSYARASFDPSTDEWTWEKPVDITTTLYNILPYVKSMFCTSGKICQSKTIKVGDYYRIYTGLCTRTTYGGTTNYNWVLYSDDFGETWKVLGSSTSPAISAGDECKCEELPNGNVVLSSRVAKGRIFNIFTYTDKENASGSWGSQRNPTSSDNGIYYSSDSNPCNGEILFVNAIRQSDNQEVVLALHSIAYNRNITYVYYKALDSESDYNSPTNFAKDWEGRYLISNTNTTSCYSTMVKQWDNRIGFYHEEASYNSGYNMIYYRYPLETITNNAYSLVYEIPDEQTFNLTTHGVTSDKLTYSRQNITSDGTFTVCLPFSMTVDEATANGVTKVEELSAVDEERKVIRVKDVTSNGITAYKPYIVTCEAGALSNVELWNHDVTILPDDCSTTAGTGKMIGNFTYKKNMEGYYGFRVDGTGIGKGTSTAYVNAFRSYFDISSGSGAKSYDIDRGDGTTDIALLTNDGELMMNAQVFDLQGRKLLATNELPKGIYIVNNKKVVIR